MSQSFRIFLQNKTILSFKILLCNFNCLDDKISLFERIKLTWLLTVVIIFRWIYLPLHELEIINVFRRINKTNLRKIYVCKYLLLRIICFRHIFCISLSLYWIEKVYFIPCITWNFSAVNVSYSKVMYTRSFNQVFEEAVQVFIQLHSLQYMYRPCDINFVAVLPLRLLLDLLFAITRHCLRNSLRSVDLHMSVFWIL